MSLSARRRRIGAARQTAPEIAAAWVLREDGGSLRADDQSRLEAWLAADPAHRAAYDNAREACSLAVRHAAAPEIMALREAALRARGDIVPRDQWRLAAGLLTAAVLVMAIWITADRLAQYRTASLSSVQPAAAQAARAIEAGAGVHETAIGERLTIALPDGSVATLDTDSALSIEYTAEERGIHLIRGQALFEVAKNKPVPFQVYASDRRITAVGTLFDVRLDGPKVKVALIEGVVRVAPSANLSIGASFQPVTLRAGEVLEAAPAKPAKVRAGGAARAETWKDGVVIFEDMRLADAVAEINRYATKPIMIADAALGAYRVSGVFMTGDPDRFAKAMTDVFPIVLDRTSNGPVLRERKP